MIYTKSLTPSSILSSHHASFLFYILLRFFSFLPSISLKIRSFSIYSFSFSYFLCHSFFCFCFLTLFPPRFVLSIVSFIHSLVFFPFVLGSFPSFFLSFLALYLLPFSLYIFHLFFFPEFFLFFPSFEQQCHCCHKFVFYSYSYLLFFSSSQKPQPAALDRTTPQGKGGGV